MQFVLNPNPLPFESAPKKGQGQQYYEWRYQKKMNQIKQQQNQLQNFLQNIRKQEQNESKSTVNKRRIHHEGSFYDYNVQWKNKLNSRIDQVKHAKDKQEAQSQLEIMKRQEKQHKKQSLDGYRGPIEGWKQRFEYYLQRKICNETAATQQTTFQPKINDRSRKMTQGMVGRVEDRLLNYGEFVKMKNQEELNKANSQIINFNAMNKKYDTNQTNQSQIFYRLYRQGEQTNRKKKQTALDERHTFQPKTNKIPTQMQMKVAKSRKPLYYIKQNVEELQDQKQCVEKKPIKGNFEAFMKRNEALLNLKKKMGMALIQQREEKQNLQKSECTFTPILNNKSKKIRRQVDQNNKKLQEHIQNQIKISMAYPPSNCGLQNIDISKLTIPQCKQASQYDDSDSLSIYRIEHGQKDTNRFVKKQQQYETYVSNSKVRSQRQQQPLSVCPSSDLIVGKAMQDSIEKMRSTQWESEISQIENHLQNMMSRAIK